MGQSAAAKAKVKRISVVFACKWPAPTLKKRMPKAGAIGTRESELKSRLRVLCLPVASCCQLGKAETSVRRRFLGSLQSKPLACLWLIKWSAGPEAQ